jgi:hypothetical protein
MIEDPADFAAAFKAAVTGVTSERALKLYCAIHPTSELVAEPGVTEPELRCPEPDCTVAVLPRLEP